ncbi:monoamine oxidase [Saccharothrix saharensis]|uniref:Monoamine oxidase n=1 Tax=Saccharothrix saharensis TaxID=571190 RepID=A0A543JNP3_9PSEU|nr:NAD(P)/FAD-dependent oxidoreductase [Saccharothrix saharensis]TQM84459.1 monoamine oxidase [Saccharothrix saharensis]
MRSVHEGDVLDAAVVGAGPAGCYSAYRLAGAGRSVALYERSDRIGGRLWSVSPRHAPDLVADLGAMRVHRGLRPVLGLLHALGLDGDLVPFSFSRPENLVQRHGVVTRAREVRPVPDDLVAQAAERLVPGFADLRRRTHEARGDRAREDVLATFRRRRDRVRLADRPLGRLTWPQALDFALGANAVAFLHDVGGYDLRHSGESAAARLDLLLRTPPDAEYLTLRHGMQSVTDALHAGFTAAGGHTRTGSGLLRLDRESGHYRLTFAGLPPARARAVVLALPPEALRDLDPDGLPVPRRLHRALDAVEAVPAFKLFLLYARPWWRRLAMTEGRSTTDTALRQLWYGGTGPSTAADGPALVLAAYPSGRCTRAWTPYRDSRPHHAAGPAPTPAAAMVDHAHALLARMHRLPDLDRPLDAWWADWSAAWHVWRPGHDARDHAPVARHPLAGERVHVVSDCWTPDPGSLEGTLTSAEDVLRTCFGLPVPSWWRP